MLEYYKLILEKVSFHEGLFEKELKKSLHNLSTEEAEKFLEWVSLTYGDSHFEIIDQAQKALF